MFDPRMSFRYEALLAAVVLAYVAINKYSEYRFRKRCIAVVGTIARVFPHRHCTSHFITYSFNGVDRVAEYRGPPMAARHQAGRSITILINPEDPPNTPIPDSHNAPGAGMGSGNCALAGAAMVTFWDVFYVAASIGLIVYSMA